MENFKIVSLIASVHDTSYGGYPYKVTAIIEIPIETFNEMCPKTGPSHTTLFGRRPAQRDLGALCLDVSNAIYVINKNIWASNPSIDATGGSRAKNGVKTLRFEYFSQNTDRAKGLGFQHHKDGTTVKYGQPSINLLAE